MENTIDPPQILDFLVSMDVLTLKEHQDITETIFYPDKVKSIIKYILRKDEEAFLYFFHAVQKYYPPLANKILQAMKGGVVTKGCVLKPLT